MTPGELTGLLQDPAYSGVYFVDPGDGAVLMQAAADIGYATLDIDLAECADKAGLMQGFAAAGRFPDWFGGNWDALADALADLSWFPAPGYVWRIEHGDDWREQHPEDFATLIDILDEAVARWVEAGTAFWVALPIRP